MGVDIYLRWSGQTADEREAQITGFSVYHGRTGYLYEAYHGGIFTTRMLVPEAWDRGQYVPFPDDIEPQYEDEETVGVPFSAATLRQRLPDVLAACKRRYREIYGRVLEDGAPELQSYSDFVALAEQKEAEGKQIYIALSY